MKAFRDLLILLFVIGIIIFVASHAKKNPIIEDLKNKINNQERHIAKNEERVAISLNLLKTPIWYVVNAHEVSSLPDGKGERVIFIDRPLMAIGNHLGIKHPDRNVRIKFLPSTSRSGEAYVFEGGWLTYQYVD